MNLSVATTTAPSAGVVSARPAPGRQRMAHLLWLAGPAAVGVVSLLFATRHGPYTSPDSTFYVGLARNVVDGDGLVAPAGYFSLSNFPPLFSLVLAAIGWFGPEPLDAARWLNALLLGATVTTASVVIRRLTGSLALAVAGGLLLVAARDLLTYHGSALSEPLFIFLTLAGLVALAAHVEQRSPLLLVAAAALVALATLTRYVGVAVVVAGVLGLLRSGRDRRWHGAVDAAVFAVLALAPVGTWAAWAAQSGDGADGRDIAFHFFDWSYLRIGAGAVGSWVVPAVANDTVRAVAAVALLTVLVWAVLWLRRTSDDGRSRPVPEGGDLNALPFLLGAFSGVYVAVLVADRLFVDATGRLDGRFMGPAHVAVVILSLAFAGRIWRERSEPARRSVAVLGMTLVVLQVAWAATWLADGVTDDGIVRRGYAAAVWERSAVLERIRGADPAVTVVTNDPYGASLHTGRRVIPLPRKRDYHTGKANADYERQLLQALNTVRTGGVLAYFDARNSRFRALPTEPELREMLTMEVVVRDPVGTLYRAAP